jgi:MFS family permease
VRQTAVPVGGLVGALTMPAAVSAGGVRAAFLVLAALCALGAALGAAFLRERSVAPAAVDVEWTLRDGRLWLVSWGSGLYLVAQVAILGFLVLYLHDERGFSTAAGAGVLAAINVLAAVFRIAAGRWSDLLGSRLRPLRWIGLTIAATTAGSAVATRAPIALTVAAFLLAGGFAMAWNGLAFTAAAELAGEARSGTAIGFQQTVLSVVGGVVAPVFAIVVAATSWEAAFALAALAPLAGWRMLAPLRDG